ncbi:MAG: hypothetical protein QUS12_09250 [Methanosarcina sp.]|nr:hypothetical protein [Methanosarcina sp.]
MEPAIADSYPEKRWISQEIETVHRLWKAFPESTKKISVECYASAIPGFRNVAETPGI